MVERKAAARGLEVGEPAPVVLALEREAAILEARVDGDHVVVELLDGHPSASAPVSNGLTPSESLICVALGGSVVARSGLRGCGRPRCRSAWPPLVVLEVAEAAARAELAGGRHPAHARAVGQVARVVGRGHAELAEVGVDRGRVVEPRRAARPVTKNAGREAAAEEVLRHLPVARPPRTATSPASSAR